MFRTAVAGVVITAAIIFGLPVSAQEQVGSIEGVVRDQQSGVVPGSIVEAHNLAVGATVTTIDRHGRRVSLRRDAAGIL